MFETDDDDFTLTPSSKLASIFANTPVSDDNSSSLTYRAPKQPKSNSDKPVTNVPNSQPQTQSSVVQAEVVTLWKQTEGKNKLQGKHMMAIIGSTAKNLFEVIVYQEKTNIVIRETLGTSLTFYKHLNKFVSFYDKNQQFWSVNFDAIEQMEGFLHHCKNYNCNIIEQHKQYDNSNGAADNSETNGSKTSSSKGEILSRITKMGQAILPRDPPQHENDSSQSETESSYSDPKPIKPVVAPRKVKRKSHIEDKALTTISHIPDNNNRMCPTNQLQLNHLQSGGLVYSQPLPFYDPNSYTNVQLNELSRKLDVCLNTLGQNKSNGNDVAILNSKIKSQKLKIENLSTDLERAYKETEKLKLLYEEKCLEVDAKKEDCEQLKRLQVDLKVWEEKANELASLPEEIQMLQTDLKHRDGLIDSLKEQVSNLQDNINTKQSLVEELSRHNMELGTKLENSHTKLKQQEEKEFTDFNKEKFSRTVKETMNEAYINIMGNFDENKTYGVKEIQRVLLENLKSTSYQLMNNL